MEKEEIKPKLLPCPFCGGEAVISQKVRNGYEIKCRACCIKRTQRVIRNSMEWLYNAMIADWNTRVPASTAQHELDLKFIKEQGGVSLDEAPIRSGKPE